MIHKHRGNRRLFMIKAANKKARYLKDVCKAAETPSYGVFSKMSVSDYAKRKDNITYIPRNIGFLQDCARDARARAAAKEKMSSAYEDYMFEKEELES